MSVFCHRGLAPLAMPNLSTHCHVSFTAFSACDSIHKHPCSTLECAPRAKRSGTSERLTTRMFAICLPLLRYPRPSPGTWSHFRPISAALGPQLPYNTNPVQTCAANTNSSAWQPRTPPTRRASPVCEALQFVYDWCQVSTMNCLHCLHCSSWEVWASKVCAIATVDASELDRFKL